MAKSGAYRLVFSEGAAEFLVGQSKRRQREILELAQKLADHPFVRSDYHVPDEAGREIDHLMIESYVFAYWLDHAVREIRIAEIEDAT